MRLRGLLLLGMVCLLSGCPHSVERRTTVAPSPHPVVKSNHQIRPVSAFTRVVVKGRLNVRLHTGQSYSKVQLQGASTDLAAVLTVVKNGTLMVTLPKGRTEHGPVQVDIDTRYLNYFEYHGNGTIIGQRLRASLLDLVIDNDQKTYLQGQIGLRKLDVTGNGSVEIIGIQSPDLQMTLAGKSKVKLAGLAHLVSLHVGDEGWVSLYWVKSDHLSIEGHGKSFIQLAGVAQRLEVELWDDSCFNGRYLRAERAFVKTHDTSSAEISAVKRQHTLATDSSDIQFYNIPTMKTDFMAYDGAVLDMRDLASPFVQEYNRYNK